MELQIHPTVEIEPQSALIRSTHWVRHAGLVQFRSSC